MEIKISRKIGEELLIYEKSVQGRRGVKLPAQDVPETEDIPKNLLRSEPAGLPEISELDLVRHFTNLSRLNFSVDTNFYPLGSCTMKYNAKALEQASSLEGFCHLHPLTSCLPGGEAFSQGALEVIFESERLLAEITGMDAVTSQPLAGAHGEMTGIMLIAAYHRSKGNKKSKVIVPDTSHGTNPASAAMAGYEIVTIPSLSNGEMDFEAFKAALTGDVAAVMMTCPNTLGIFETRIKEIADLAHSFDALMYYDGANLNAVMGKVRPGDIGFDVIHVNVHKTFGTPHGGGGPGAGPVGVKEFLIPFLPLPRVMKNKEGAYYLIIENKESIGKIASFFGNFGVLLKAFAYILILGGDGLIDASEQAVLNANYIMTRLKGYYYLPYDRTCMHECVFSAEKQLCNNIHAIDIAKGLIDKGFHPPTVYFPLIVKEAIMIEPTETESKATMDSFIEVMIELAENAKNNPDYFTGTPKNMPSTRLEQTKAARDIKVRCFG